MSQHNMSLKEVSGALETGQDPDDLVPSESSGLLFQPTGNDSPSPRRVWVLLFDQLQIENTDTASAFETESRPPNKSPGQFDAFDDLDLQCSLFEHYILQDSRSSAGLTGMLGGEVAFSRFSQLLKSASKSSGRVSLKVLDTADGLIQAEITAAMVPMAFEDEQSAAARFLEVSRDSLRRNEAELEAALVADVVWIEAQTSRGTDSADCNSLLKLVQQWRSDAQADSGKPIVFIVSAIRGSAKTIAPPFTSGLNESLIHVPLWIDHGAGHACRIQTLVGSFDLLPTIEEFLLGEDRPLITNGTEPPESIERSLEMHGLPRSLVGVCAHSKPLPDRLLSLTGDNFTALRTQQYLLVHPIQSKASLSGAGDSEGDAVRATRSLYLKPDDLWNVNDAIVAYSAIADQMEMAAARHQELQN